jgi:hypothetical protein
MAYTFRDFEAEGLVLADFVVVVAHVFIAPPKPEVAESIRA